VRFVVPEGLDSIHAKPTCIVSAFVSDHCGISYTVLKYHISLLIVKT